MYIYFPGCKYNVNRVDKNIPRACLHVQFLHVLENELLHMVLNKYVRVCMHVNILTVTTDKVSPLPHIYTQILAHPQCLARIIGFLKGRYPVLRGTQRKSLPAQYMHQELWDGDLVGSLGWPCTLLQRVF